MNTQSMDCGIINIQGGLKASLLVYGGHEISLNEMLIVAPAALSWNVEKY